MTDPGTLIRQVARLRVDPSQEMEKMRIATDLCKALGLSNCELGDIVADTFGSGEEYEDYDEEP